MAPDRALTDSDARAERPAVRAIGVTASPVVSKIGAEVAEGLLLLENAARIQVKNRVLVDVLTSDGSVDVAAWTGMVAATLRRLSDEARASERRLLAQLQNSRERRGTADHEHDYRAQDLGNLDRRRRVTRKIRKRLARRAASPTHIAALLRQAQQDAWQEIRTAAAALPNGEDRPADQHLIEGRLRLLTSIDLPALAASRPHRIARGGEGATERS